MPRFTLPATLEAGPRSLTIAINPQASGVFRTPIPIGTIQYDSSRSCSRIASCVHCQVHHLWPRQLASGIDDCHAVGYPGACYNLDPLRSSALINVHSSVCSSQRRRYQA